MSALELGDPIVGFAIFAVFLLGPALLVLALESLAVVVGSSIPIQDPSVNIKSFLQHSVSADRKNFQSARLLFRLQPPSFPSSDHLPDSAASQEVAKIVHFPPLFTYSISSRVEAL